MKNDSKSRHCIWGIVLSVVLSVGSAGALVLNDGGYHVIDDSYIEEVRVDEFTPGARTTVEVVSGGEILEGTFAIFEDGDGRVSGGYVNFMSVHDRGLAFFPVNADGSVSWLNLTDTAGATINGGSVWTIDLQDSATAAIYGGSFGDITATDSSAVSISGGQMVAYYLNAGYSEGTHDSFFILVGSEFYVNDIVVADGQSAKAYAYTDPNSFPPHWWGSIQGTLQGGEPFYCDFNIYDNANIFFDIRLTYGPIVYVDAQATGANNGSSWANAFASLQDALEMLRNEPPEETVQVWVANGTYVPCGDLDLSFDLVNQCALYGGFPSIHDPCWMGGDPVWEDRDPLEYETVLSGDMNGDDDWFYQNNFGDNCSHVVTAHGLTYALVDGFTIQGGNADGSEDDGYGAGVYVTEGQLVLRQCTIYHNQAVNGGGGLAVVGGHVTLESCEFFENFTNPGGYYSVGDSKYSGTLSIRSGLYFEDSVATAQGYWTVYDDRMVVTGESVIDGSGVLDIANATFYSLADPSKSENRTQCRIDVGGWDAGFWVDPDSRFVLQEDAVFEFPDANDPNERTYMDCRGLLGMTDQSRMAGIDLRLFRGGFGGNTILENCVIEVMPGAVDGQIYAAQAATIRYNEIYSTGDTYLDLNPATFVGQIYGNNLHVTVDTDRLLYRLELRGDPNAIMPWPDPCEFVWPVVEVPWQDMDSWTLDELVLEGGSRLTLTNRELYGGEEPGEILYVRRLVLGANSILNVNSNYVFFQEIVQHPTAKIRNFPLLGFDLALIDFDDQEEYKERVSNNNFIHPEHRIYNREHVVRAFGELPDPCGFARMFVLPDLDPCSPTFGELIKPHLVGSFGRAVEDEIIVRFQYMFESDDVYILVYLCDSPELGPECEEIGGDSECRCIQLGRIDPPPGEEPDPNYRGGRAGSVASGRFGTFYKRVNVAELDFTNGSYVHVVVVPKGQTYSPSMPLDGDDPTAPADGSSGGSVSVGTFGPEIYCSGYCMDVTGNHKANEADFLTVLTKMGTATSAYCLDGTFSSDGAVSAADASSWDWVIRQDELQELGSFCSVPLVSGVSAAADVAEAWLDGLLDSDLSEDIDLLILGKKNSTLASEKMKDHLFGFDTGFGFVSGVAPQSDRCNERLVKDWDENLYELNSKDGLCSVLSGVTILTSGSESGIADPRNGGVADVYVGLQGTGDETAGRPLLDVAFDPDYGTNGYVYVVPVVVEPDDSDPNTEPYLAAAQLCVQGGGAFDVIRLYDDPPEPNDNQYRDALAEVEIDDAGHLFVLNSHQLNESDIVWKFDADTGSVLERCDLGNYLLTPYIPAPTAMHFSAGTDTLYLTSSLYNADDPNNTLIYGLDASSTDMPLVRQVTVTQMHHITSIAEDPVTNDLWAVGFNMHNVPDEIPATDELPFYVACIAHIEPGQTQVSGVCPDPNTHELALPTSAVWTGPAGQPCEGADLSGDGLVDFADFEALACCWTGATCDHVDCADADLSGSEGVGIADLRTIATYWLRDDCLSP